MNTDKRPVALTMGDPAGIGIEITLKAWLQRQDNKLPDFFLLADPSCVRDYAQRLDLQISVQEINSADEAVGCFDRALPVLPVHLQKKIEPAKPESEAATAIVGSIEKAVELAKGGQASAVVTNPIAKSVLYEAGFSHPGHTEFLGELAKKYDETRCYPVMMLASDQLRVVPVTIHIPLKAVSEALSKQDIIETVKITEMDLRNRFNISDPRIAITGLNPHAGENGSLGAEEIDTIIPAIDELKEAGLNVTGPHPADAIFHYAARQTYDAVVAMYHDQALIPIKTLDFDKGVNVTLGLPFIRTSPDHGTAFDIAGKGIANPQSLIEAIKLADTMASSQKGQL